MKIWSSFLNFDHYFILEFSTLSICKIYNESLEDFFSFILPSTFQNECTEFFGQQRNGPEKWHSSTCLADFLHNTKWQPPVRAGKLYCQTPQARQNPQPSAVTGACWLMIPVHGPWEMPRSQCRCYMWPLTVPYNTDLFLCAFFLLHGMQLQTFETVSSLAVLERPSLFSWYEGSFTSLSTKI